MLVDFSKYTWNKPKGFIVLEGLNGAGKSSLLKKINHFFDSQSIEYINTFEPGGSPIGAALRKILMEQAPIKLNSIAELLLFCAERAEHVSKVIVPALSAGKIVICDRFYYSTLSFQGYGRGIDLETVATACRTAIQDTYPDLVILLDIDPVLALERIGKRNSSETDCFEQEELDFHSRLRTGFIEIAKNQPEPFALIDANQDEENVWAQLRPTLASWTKCFVEQRS